MARTRNLKPGFFANEELVALGFQAMIAFCGLWTIADREGRLEDRPRRIKAVIFPYSPKVNVDKLMQQLHDAGFISRYEVDGARYVQIVNWHKHQNPHHMELPSEIPSPIGADNRFKHSPITKEQRQRIFSRDGFTCVECGEKTQLCIDHIIPVSSGGTSTDSNLRTLCKGCNEKKGKRRLQVVDDPRTSRGRPEHGASTPALTLNPSSLTLNQPAAEPDSSVISGTKGELPPALIPIQEALRPHGEAIGREPDLELVRKIAEASQGQPLTAASWIGKIWHRRFSERAVHRQPAPESLGYWITAIREEAAGGWRS